MEKITHYAPSKSWLAAICRCRGIRSPRRSRCCCISLRDKPNKPDLAIYSQLEAANAGDDPTWDSPDITSNHWGPFRLMEEAKVVVRNLSPAASATNVLVHYYIAPFGIGTPKQLFATRKVNVYQGSEVELLFPLSQEIQSGDPRVGVHIRIEHPHDTNSINNEGSQVHDGSFTSEVGRNHSIQIPVMNNSAFNRRFVLSILTADVAATIEPATFDFAPYEQIDATLHINVPGTLHGTPDDPIHRSVTVVGHLSTGEMIGGATKLLRIDD